MKWQGIRRNSIDASDALDQGLLLVNGRFKIDGELRRRRGMARSNIVKKGNAVKNISGFSAYQSNVMAALVDGSNLQGYQQPAALWGDNPTPYTIPDIDRVTSVTVDYGATSLESSYAGAPSPLSPGVSVLPRDGAVGQARWFKIDTIIGAFTYRRSFRFNPNTNTGQVDTAVWKTSDPLPSTCWIVWDTSPGTASGTWSGGYSLAGVIGTSSWPDDVVVTVTY